MLLDILFKSVRLKKKRLKKIKIKKSVRLYLRSNFLCFMIIFSLINKAHVLGEANCKMPSHTVSSFLAKYFVVPKHEGLL